MLTDLKIHEFAEDLGSDKTAPGGGSASALSGALAASLAKMVAHLSGEGHEDTISQGKELSDKLLDLVNRDTEAFNKVMASFRLPRQTDEEKAARRQAIQDATRLATEVPFEMVELCLQVLALAKKMTFEGNKNCLSDAGVAGLLGVAACKGASYNVLINLPSLKDEEFVSATKERLTAMLSEADQIGQEIATHLQENLG